MENIKLEKSSQNFEQKNILEKSFEQKHIKEILSKIFSLNELQIKELNEYTWTKYNKEKKYFSLWNSHEKSISDLEDIISRKQIEQNSNSSSVIENTEK